jgi:regulatory protein
LSAVGPRRRSIALVKAEDHAERALALAYRYVGRRERTIEELRSHLAAKGIEPSLTGEAIAALTEQGLLDDARFARLFVEDKRTLEDWGSERIARALRERGVERDLVQAALAAGGSHGEELERALQLLRRRCPQPPVEHRERERALGILLRKGFEPDLALEALGAYARDPEAVSHR